MNRRHLLRLSLISALSPTSVLHAADSSGKSTGSAKKGLGTGMRDGSHLERLEALRCKWFYSWNSRIPDRLPRGLLYSPMIFKYHGDKDAVKAAVKTAKRSRMTELLAFNEPDEKKQAHMTVEQALEAWPLLEDSGLRLGSPAAVHPDNEWMQRFMKEAKTRKFRVDFVCVHSYGPPDAAHFLRRMQQIHKLYRKPIWITEFACGDWSAASAAKNRHSPESVLRFMESVLPKLDRMDFIERYAWFPAKPDSAALGTSALFDEAGKLTRLGECYRDA